MKKLIALVFKSLLITTLLINEAVAQQCSENTNVNGIAGTSFSNGTIGQSFTACKSGLLASVSVQAGSASTGFNYVVAQIFSGDGFGGTLLATTAQVHVKANRTTTWGISNVEVIEGQKYTARFTTQSGTPMMAYGSSTNAANDYYSRGRIHGAAQAHNDMFFSAVIETLGDPVKSPEDDAVAVTRDSEVKLGFSRAMEALTGDITINNITDATSETVDVTTLTIDGAEVFMPLSKPLEGGKDFEIIIPANTLQATNGISFSGIAAGEWTFTTSTSPYAILNTTSSSLTNDAVIPFSIDFSDVVTGFDLTDFVITNGAASNLAGSSDSFTFDVTPSAEGEVVISLPVDQVEAGTSNGNDSTGYALVYDGTVPSVELNTDASGTIQTSIFEIEVVFSEPVTGFEPTDLLLTNVGVLSSISTNDSLFTISLQAQAEGQVTVDLPSGIADDLAGNANTAAPAIIDLTFSVDLEDGLLSYYPFDGNADDTVSTGFNGTVTGATLTAGFDGTADGAYSFDGGDVIAFGDTPIGAGSFTVAFWVKIPEGLTQNQSRTILGKRVVCGEGRFFEINYNNTSANGHQISVEQRNNAGTASPIADLSSVGEWTHIAFVKDNELSQSSFYINGVQQTPVAWTTTYDLENSANLTAGRSACDGNGRFKLSGAMDDLYVYGRALTAVEIDLLAPLVLRNTSVDSGSDIQAGQTIDLIFNKNLVQSSINTTNITAAGSVSGSLAISLNSSQDNITVTPPSTGWPLDEDITISLSGILAENGTTLANTDLTYSVIADEAVGLILHYPISGNVNEAVGDIAGQDGTVSGALFAEGFDGDPFGALAFDGTDDLVTLGDAPISSESFSISMWLKVPSDGSTTENTIILSKRTACTEGRMINMWYLRSGDKFRIVGGLRDNASAGNVATGFDFPVNEWVNVTFVKNNSASDYKLIVNGVLAAEASWTLSSVNVENSTPIKLGVSPCVGNGEQRFDGLIDDLRIYDRVIKPRVLSIEPVKGTLNAAVDTVVTIAFDRAVDVSSLEASTVQITDTNDVSYAYTTAFSSGDSVLTITPDSFFPKGKEITVAVDTLSAQVGSDFLPFQTSFTTVYSQLLSHFPANGTSDVDSLETISFKFDNAIDMSSLDQGIQIIGSQHGPVEGSFSMPATDSVVFTPSKPYFPNEMITVYVTPSLEDVGGERIGNNKAFMFHVASPQFVNPTLSFELTKLTTSLSTLAPRDLVAADLDNDGDLDLVGGDENPGTLFWFENQGFGNFSEGIIIDSNNDYWDIDVTDFDFDGDTDIVTISRVSGKGVYWYENNGSASFTERLIVSIGGSADLRAVKAADFNGDGSMDVVTADYGLNRLTVYDKDGTSLFAAANVGAPVDVQVADRENDGDLDLYLANYTNGNVATFANGGAATFSGSALHSATHMRTVMPIDFDKDGDIDIVYAAQSASQIGVLENNGDLTYTNHQVGSIGGPHRIDVGDIDGDGDFDIIYSVAGGASEMNFYYLENNGSFGLWVAKKLISTETFSGIFTQTVKFADVDNDGDLDVLATDAGTGFFIFENKIIDLNNGPLLENPIADQSMEEDSGVVLSINVSNVFVDLEGDSFTLDVEVSDPGVTAVLSGIDLDISSAADFFGEVTITLTADDGNGVNTDEFILDITPVNDAPVFDLSTASYTIDEDFTITGTIAVTQNQPENEDAPTYSISPASVSFADVSIDAATGVVSINAIADGFGTQEFTVIADDGGSVNNTATQTFTLTVNAVNDAPIVANAISDIAFDEDSSGKHAVDLPDTFSDVEDASLTLGMNVLSGSELATVTLTNDIINIAPVANAFGTVQVEVSAEDADGASVTDQFNIVINAVNDAPTFTTSGDITITKNFTSTESVTITEDETPFGEESQVVTYTLSPASVSFANVSIDQSTGEVSITAVADAFGTQEFTVTADDGQANNNTATQIFVLTIVDNLAPEVIATIANTTMDEDQATLSVVNVTTLFSDPETDPLTYAVSDDFGGSVSVILNGDLLEVTPAANYNGSGTVTVSASDANQTASTSFTLTVNSINDVPTLEVTLTDQEATEDQSFSYTLPSGVFADVDGDIITISVGTIPTWLTFDGAIFSGTPGNGDVASTNVEVVGDDGNGGTVTATFSLTVDNVNDAPAVETPVADVMVDEDAATSNISLSNVFEDVDAGDQLTLSASAGENSLISLVLNGETLEVGYKADASGAVMVTLTAVDGSGASVTDQFMVTVNSVNDAPVFDLSTTTVSLEENFTGMVPVAILAGLVPADEMDQTVTYTISSDDTAVINAVLNGSSIELTAILDSFGEQTFSVTANDGQSENSEHVMSFTVTVNRILSAEMLENKLSIYPNPVADYVMIDTKELVNITFYGLNGQLIKEINQVNGKVDLSTMKAGTYLMEVSTENESTTVRIQKKH